jgi:nitroreductase
MNHSKQPMSAMDAIYHRRSVRDYAPEKIDQNVIRSLLDAAVHAPTAMHEEPWSFAVIQDKKLLDRLSESAKKIWITHRRNTNDDATISNYPSRAPCAKSELG